MNKNKLDKEVQEDYETFWKEIIEPNGFIDIEQLKKELYDFHVIMKEASIVYEAVTRGRISKPNAAGSAVLSEYNNDLTENYICREDAKELIDNLIEELGL